MLFSFRSRNIKKHHHAWLYSAVYAGRFSVLLTLLLLSSFLLQPINQAYATEPSAPAPPEPVAEDVRPQEDEAPVVEESPPEEETPSTETPGEPASPTGDLGVPASLETISPVTELPPIITEPEATPADSPPAVEDPPFEPPESEPAEETPGATSTEASLDVPIDPITPETQVVQVENLVTDDNFYQFSKQSCIGVGNGVFHCTNRDDADVDSQSVVYSQRDDNGDMEIFLKTARGKVRQITDNDYDDTSPHYDPGSMRMVWQRLIDGRYQIILFDIMDEKESQLTFSKTNNMEPKVSDAGVVWQAWDDNDWEIMLFDGTYTEQITDNTVQDVAPVIQDGYVLWNVLGGETQQARVYSLDTKETVSIEGYEGGSIVNPRFVLVYDTRYDNGDVVTQTFDPATGLSEPVAAEPAPDSVPIPDTDPTGEIRALIQGKTQKDRDEYQDLTPDSSGDPNATSTTHYNDPGTLSLQATSSDLMVAQPQVVPDIYLDEYDLVIPQNALPDSLSNTQE